MGTLITDKEETPFIFPYWGDAALIIESEIKWGEQKAQEMMSIAVDNFDRELQNAEKLSKIWKQHDKASYINKSLGNPEELGKLLSETENNFFNAIISYRGDRNSLIRRLDNDSQIPQEIASGYEFTVKEDWESLEIWIDNFNFSEPRWKYEYKLLNIVRDLVFHRKLDLAIKLSSPLDGVLEWRAKTWISSSSILDKIDAYIFEGFDEPDHIFLIRAEVMSKRNQDLANAYVILYCEFIIQEKWLDDFLGWELCNSALFLYNHNDKVNAQKYFLSDIRHWFQAEYDDSWSEFTEKLLETDFEFQFKLLQEILLWNSNRNILDTVRTIQIFAMVLVSNFQYKQVVSALSAIKRTRNWHLKEETKIDPV